MGREADNTLRSRALDRVLFPLSCLLTMAAGAAQFAPIPGPSWTRVDEMPEPSTAVDAEDEFEDEEVRDGSYPGACSVGSASYRLRVLARTDWLART